MSASRIFLNYTDWHDVDEEMRTIAVCDGCWSTWGMSEASGVMCRELYDSPTSFADYVASSNMKI